MLTSSSSLSSSFSPLLVLVPSTIQSKRLAKRTNHRFPRESPGNNVEERRERRAFRGQGVEKKAVVVPRSTARHRSLIEGDAPTRATQFDVWRATAHPADPSVLGPTRAVPYLGPPPASTLTDLSPLLPFSPHHAHSQTLPRTLRHDLFYIILFFLFFYSLTLSTRVL